ncbi:MAG: lycopene cyclase family protein [Desulfobacterales bacterium]|nr:lycopene cyclase family protein [Desulfobacterales bacterium]
MERVYDVAIVGAGCSGLSLAVELVHALSGDRRIAVLEPRRSYHFDRVWCFWKTATHRFSHAVGHEWRQWKVRFGRRELMQASSQFPYQCLPADAFYEAALDTINRSPSTDLFLQTAVTDIVENKSDVCISTNRGTFRARIMFDGRNDGHQLSKLGCLLQHYTGQRIRAHRPVFDSRTVTLMDFDVTQRHGITFVYVLPFSESEALVEPTVISHLPLETDVYIKLIRDYLSDRFDLNNYEVLFQEQGVIPMTAELSPPKMPTRLIPIGTAAGMVKGSTGYGFLPIQKWSRAVAGDIAAGRHQRLPKPRPWLSTYMDRIFLSFLAAHPSEAPEVFFHLFQRVPADRLVRFLSDKASVIDIFRVIAAMPKRPFIRQAGRVSLAGGTAS